MRVFNAGEQADTRLELLADWLAGPCALKVEKMAPASADASFRRYFRVWVKGGTRIVMDAPPPMEDVTSFIAISQRLRSIGVEAPLVYAQDATRGFVLLGDLGCQTYLAALDDRGEAERLYGDALHVLAAMQSRLEHTDLPAYDAHRLHTEMQLFHDWLLVKHLGLSLTDDESRGWRASVDYLTDAALSQPVVFVHRDYHSRNLMVGRPGAPGVLDFQDAVAGPLTYDVVSLLKDCYITWPRERVLVWLRQYFDLAGQTSLRDACATRPFEDWCRAFDDMGVQRHLKASGIFARLLHRDGKSAYMNDVPRVLDYIITACDGHPHLNWLHGFVAERVLPALTTHPKRREKL